MKFMENTETDGGQKKICRSKKAPWAGVRTAAHIRVGGVGFRPWAAAP